MPSSSSSGSAGSRHVLLFRHCVRSTDSRIALHNNGTAFLQGTEPPFRASDFVQEDAPDWGVPPNWCTEQGVRIVERTGRFLFDMLARQVLNSTDSETTKVNIHFQVLVDEAQRDVDTYLALYKGLRLQSRDPTANPNGRIQLKGLRQVILDRRLFEPFHHEEGICQNPLAMSSSTTIDYASLLQQQIQNRLDTVPPPEPGLQDTLAKLERRGGRGSLGTPVSKIPSWISGTESEIQGVTVNTSSLFPVMVSTAKPFLAGPINIIKWMAEMVFYSRAGGITTPFLWNVTLPELYRLVEWIHWSRTILEVENFLVAAMGAIKAQVVLDALQYGQLPAMSMSDSRREDSCSNHKSKDDDTIEAATVTLIIGHDGDMDAVATALNLRWRLGAPYHTSPGNHYGEYLPTPPGSAMHFELDPATGSVQMDFLYPVYLQYYDRRTSEGYRRMPLGMQWNSSGILVPTPMVVKPRSHIDEKIMKPQLSEDGTRMVLKDFGLQVLETQLAATLQVFPDAKECYRTFLDLNAAAVGSTRNTGCNNGQSSSNTDAFSIRGIAMGMLGSLWIALLGFLVWRQCCQPTNKKRAGAQKYSQISLVEDDGVHKDSEDEDADCT